MKDQSLLNNESAMIQFQLGKRYLKNSNLSGKSILFAFLNFRFKEKIITIRSSRNLVGTCLIFLAFFCRRHRECLGTNGC